MGEIHMGCWELQLVEPLDCAFSIGSMKVGALVLGFQDVNLNPQTTVVGNPMNSPEQVLGAPLRTGRRKKKLDPTVTIISQLIGELADQPKVIFRICGARRSDLCPRRLFKSGWQAGKKLFVAINEVIAIAYIETERHANTGFGIGLDPFAHIALILGRTAA